MLRLEVEWVDSGTFRANGWESLDEILPHARIGTVTTVGLLAHEDDETLYLALSHDPDNEHYFGIQAIKKSNILSRVVLRARRKDA